MDQLSMLAAMLASGTNLSAKEAVDKAEAIVAEVEARNKKHMEGRDA